MLEYEIGGKVLYSDSSVDLRFNPELKIGPDKDGKFFKIDDDEAFISFRSCIIVAHYGKVIEYNITPECPDSLKKSYIMGYGLSLIKLQRREVVFHASTLFYQGEAVLLSGISGSGKSTVASELVNKGCTFMTDDTVTIKNREGALFALPGMPYRKLDVNTANKLGLDFTEATFVDDNKGKFLFPMEDKYHDAEEKVKTLYILNRSNKNEKIGFSELVGDMKLRMIKASLFLWKFMGDSIAAGLADEVIKEMCEKIKVVVVNFPKEGYFADKISTWIIDEIK